MNGFIDKLFLLSVKYREPIVTAFKIAYVLLSVVIVIGSFSLYQRNAMRGTFINYAVTAGQISVILYVLTIVPGVFRRFGKQHKIVSFLMIYRRYIGILTFFTSFYHYMMERGVSLILLGPPKTIPVFEIFGTLSFYILFFLAVTSNDLSTKKLGAWWGKIHALTYVCIWLMFAHVALQRLSIWSLLLGIAGGVQVLSFVYSYLRKRSVLSS